MRFGLFDKWRRKAAHARLRSEITSRRYSSSARTGLEIGNSARSAILRWFSHCQTALFGNRGGGSGGGGLQMPSPVPVLLEVSEPARKLKILKKTIRAQQKNNRSL